MSKQIILHEAIVKGSIEIILGALRQNADLKATNVGGDTALHLAFQNEEFSEAQIIEILEILLDRGIDINVRNLKEETILHLAIERRMRDAIDFCLRRNADTSVSDVNGNTYAHFAILKECNKFTLSIRNRTIENPEAMESESSSFVIWMMSRGFDFFHRRNSINLSAFYLANELNLSHILLALLKRIDDLPALENNQRPFINAFLESFGSIQMRFSELPRPIESSFAGSRHVNDIVDLILKKSPSIDDRTLVLALHSACERPVKLDGFVVSRLIERGAKVDAALHSETPLCTACRRGQVRVAEKLIEYGADLGDRDDNQQTLLHLAVFEPRMIEFLIENGLDPNAKDDLSRTPLHIARHSEVVKALLDAGALVDAQDGEGNSPLSYSLYCQFDPMAIVELLKGGADMRDPKVLARTLDHWRHKLRHPALYTHCDEALQHWIKLTVAGLLDGTGCEYRTDGLVFRDFQAQCLEEVESLKCYFVDDRTSLYDLLRASRKRRCAYVDNETLKSLVEDVAIEKKFPNYFVLIMGCYNEARARKPLLQKAQVAWHEVTDVYLPDLCIVQIFTYLSNVDLIRFIDASEM